MPTDRHPISSLKARAPQRDTGHSWSRGLITVPAGLAIAGTLVLVGGSAASAAQAPVGLGTAGQFAVLAGSGVTNTGATTVTGDIGSYPTPTETGFGSITLSGTNQAGDSVTQQAKTDLLTAYNDAGGRTPVTNVPVELGGTTLVAGVYTSPTLGLTGTLTLDAHNDPDAEFIFQAGSTLITASNSRVLLLNGANACNVVWQVGSSATFNTGSQFVGEVLAETSITADTSAIFLGRLLAQNGAVTLDNNTITKASCASASPTTTTSTTSSTTTSTSTTSTSTTTTVPVTSSGRGATPPGPVVISSLPKGGGPVGPPPTAGGTATKSGPSNLIPPPATPGPGTVPGGLTASAVPSLPFTGSPVGELSVASLVLIGLGAALRLIRRRR
jgi:hypothetical protein